MFLYEEDTGKWWKASLQVKRGLSDADLPVSVPTAGSGA